MLSIEMVVKCIVQNVESMSVAVGEGGAVWVRTSDAVESVVAGMPHVVAAAAVAVADLVASAACKHLQEQQNLQQVASDENDLVKR